MGDFMPLCTCGRTTFIVMPSGSRLRGEAMYSRPLISRKPYYFPKSLAAVEWTNWLRSIHSI